MDPFTPQILRSDRFTDLGTFPVEFENADDALECYNEYGSWHRVQFKFISKTYRPDG